MKAIILLSGGLDSTVVLALALEKKLECLALSFDYGQRHRLELESAKAVTKHYAVAHKIIAIDSRAFGNSTLVTNKPVPKNRTAQEINSGIPSTYVPARNTIFIAFALAQAELYEAQEIHVGANRMDRIPYPDCTPLYLNAYQGLMNVATKQALAGHAPKLIAPLIEWDKSEIVRQGKRVQAPLELTMSCYDPTKNGIPCQECDACVLRRSAFK
jgi:7-cyano-7-deazaguanine synthase